MVLEFMGSGSKIKINDVMETAWAMDARNEARQMMESKEPM